MNFGMILIWIPIFNIFGWILDIIPTKSILVLIWILVWKWYFGWYVLDNFLIGCGMNSVFALCTAGFRYEFELLLGWKCGIFVLWFWYKADMVNSFKTYSYRYFDMFIPQKIPKKIPNPIFSTVFWILKISIAFEFCIKVIPGF